MNYYYSLFLTLFCCCQLTVQAISSCPNLTALTDFQINKLTGYWFLFEAVQSNLSPELKCVTSHFTVIGPRNTICMVNGVQTSNGYPYTYTAVLNAVGDAKKGQFISNVIGGNYNTQFGINVLAIDQNSFHIWYGCDPKTNTVEAFLASRQRRVPESVRTKCHDILRKNNINPSDFSQINQENC